MSYFQTPVNEGPALQDARSTDIVIPIIGATGAGKSSFINLLLEHIGDERKVKVGDKLASSTHDLQSIVFGNWIQRLEVSFASISNDHRIVIIDTPGFDQTTHADDSAIIKRIISWLQESLKRKMVLGGVIYLHDISQPGLSHAGAAPEKLKLFSQCYGEAILDKVTLVTTKWGRQGDSDFTGREKELREVHWKEILHPVNGQGGATLMQLEGKHQSEGVSAWAVIIHVLRQLDVRLGHQVPVSARLEVKYKQPKQRDTRRTGRASVTISLEPALEDARPTDIVIPIMGAAGAGKSTFINHLLEHIGDRRTRVKVGDQLSSCTYDLQSIVISNQIQGRGVSFINLTDEYRIVIVDTPGFDDTTASDFQILRRIAKWLEESLKSRMILGGVIYLHDISQNRFSGTAQKNLNMFSRLCGEAALDKVVLVTSMWSLQGDRDFARREDELKDIHWRGMLQKKGGPTVMRLDPENKAGGEGASAWAVVSHILQQLDRRMNQKMLDEVLKIQTELVKERKSIRETEAAKELSEQLEEALRIQEEMMALETAEGDSNAEVMIREKEAQLRAMHEVIQKNKASLITRMTSGIRRFASSFWR